MNRSLLVRKKTVGAPHSSGASSQLESSCTIFVITLSYYMVCCMGVRVSPYKTVGTWGQEMCLVSLQCSAPWHMLGIIGTFLSQRMKIWNYQSSIYLSLCLKANWEKNISCLLSLVTSTGSETLKILYELSAHLNQIEEVACLVGITRISCNIWTSFEYKNSTNMRFTFLLKTNKTWF